MEECWHWLFCLTHFYTAILWDNSQTRLFCSEKSRFFLTVQIFSSQKTFWFMASFWMAKSFALILSWLPAGLFNLWRSENKNALGYYWKWWKKIHPFWLHTGKGLPESNVLSCTWLYDVWGEMNSLTKYIWLPNKLSGVLGVHLTQWSHI